MTLTRNLHKTLTLLLTATMLWLCGACSDDAPGPDNNGPSATAGLTIKVSAKDLGCATRALSPFEAEAADNELIHTCDVVFVKDGTVSRIDTLPEATTGVGKEEFNVILPAGSYQVYAFANLDISSLIKKDDKLSLEAVQALTYDVKADDLTSTSAIPMSGYLTDVVVSANGSVTVDGTATTEVTIPVVRMVGKLEFEFKNTSDGDITIKEISFKPGATGAVKLLPTWSGSALADPDMTGATVGAAISHIPASAQVGNSEDANTLSCSFYVREVVSDHPTGSFPFTIKYTQGESSTVRTMTALLYDLTQINRNDWIRVPITLTDGALKLDVEFYPPIGGYPPAKWEDEDDEFYIRFATGGWFSIKALVINKADGTTVNPADVEFSIAQDGVSNTAFFRKQPGMEATGEMTGEINTGLTNGDRSVVTLEVKITDKDAQGNPVTAETFKRKIHFIFQNN